MITNIMRLFLSLLFCGLFSLMAIKTSQIRPLVPGMYAMIAAIHYAGAVTIFRSDPAFVIIANVFWWLTMVGFIYEMLTYLKDFKKARINNKES